MRIAIVDDEERWRKEICHRVRGYYPDADIETFSSGDVFLEGAEVYDIVFMDVEMDGRDGFETIKEYSEYNRNGKVVFLTTHMEMANRGFCVNAFRYLDKVNLDEDMREAVGAVNATFKKEKIVCIPTIHEGELKLRSGAILYAETEKRNVRIHIDGVEDSGCITRMSMAELETLLGDAFFRCHKSFIVNLDKISRINKIDLTLKNGETVMVGRNNRAELKQKYLNWKYEYANA